MKVTNKSTVRVGAAGVAVIGIIVLFLVMFAVERIDSGQTGIIVNLAGSERGVDDAKVCAARVMLFSSAMVLM